jgi:hypothetical protein
VQECTEGGVIGSRGAAVLRPYDGGAQQCCARTMAGRSSAAPVRWRGAAVLRPYDGGAQQRCARTGSGVCGWGAARAGAQQCCARTMAGRSSAAPVRWRGAAVLRPYDGGAQQRCARTGSGVCGWGAARVGAQQCCARTMAGRSNAAPVPAAESVDGARRE